MMDNLTGIPPLGTSAFYAHMREMGEVAHARYRAAAGDSYVPSAIRIDEAHEYWNFLNPGRNLDTYL